MPTGDWGHKVARSQGVTPRFVGYMAFGYGVKVRGVQGCCILTPLLAVALLAMLGWLPVAGVRDVDGTGAG